MRTHHPEGTCIPSGSSRTQQPARDGCTRWKWACFRSGANLEPLSRRLQPGIRFIHHPIPPRPTGHLAASLPWAPKCSGGRWGLPRSSYRRFTSRAGGTCPFRVCLSRDHLCSDVHPSATGASGGMPFGCGLTAGLATQSLPGFNRQFTSHYPCGTSLAPSPPSCWQVLHGPSREPCTTKVGDFVRWASHMAVTSHARHRRLLLVAQQVWAGRCQPDRAIRDIATQRDLHPLTSRSTRANGSASDHPAVRFWHATRTDRRTLSRACT